MKTAIVKKQERIWLTIKKKIKYEGGLQRLSILL